ncbi:MAG: tetratricopeptide repeat protein [candidate division WOR-3 bacterium]|nr:tetratricopeptide repeat protein [candidate division WOR-3 bacterium]
MVFILIFILSFNREYQNFINSPQSESIFVHLMRDKTKLNEYKNNPIILWFWRSKTNDTKVDSFLKNLSIPRNPYLSGVLRWEAKESKDLIEKYNKIKLAIHFDSLSIENFLSLINLGISSRNSNFLKEALTLPVFSDFRNQIFLLGNLSILLIIALLVNFFVFIIVKFINYLPVLCHKLDPMGHNLLKGMLGFALLLIPILVLRNLYLTLIIYSIILTFIMNNRERNWLRINLILVVTIAVIMSMFNFVSFLKGQDKTYYLYQMVAMDGDIRINPESRLEKEVLAYALKKQGQYDEALALYEDLYYNQNLRSVDILNNLANLYAIYEEDERAEELYRKAMLSDRGEPYFNLALLKYRKIEYLSAGELMEQARQRGFIRAQSEPVDIAPGTKWLYNLLIKPGLNFSGPVKIPYLLILLLIFFFTFIPFKIPPPYRCAICGKPVCRACAEETGDEFQCQGCAKKLNATKNEEIEEELKESLGRFHRFIKRALSVGLNIILPGAGLIYKNKNFAGLSITFLAVMAYTPILMKSHFVRPSGWICLSLTPILLPVAAIVLLFCYVLSFLFLPGGGDAD